MKKSVRFLIIAAVSIVAAIVLRQLAIAVGGAIDTAGSILIWLTLLGFAIGVVALVIGLVLAIRAAWRWSRSPKPNIPAAPAQG